MKTTKTKTQDQKKRPKTQDPRPKTQDLRPKTKTNTKQGKERANKYNLFLDSKYRREDEEDEECTLFVKNCFTSI
jgi:hypothetical protein